MSQRGDRGWTLAKRLTTTGHNAEHVDVGDLTESRPQCGFSSVRSRGDGLRRETAHETTQERAEPGQGQESGASGSTAQVISVTLSSEADPFQT